MKLKYFGTDGIRGVIDNGLNAELAYKAGRALAILIKKKKRSQKVVIGKDTRESGDCLICAFSAGLTDYGCNVILLGVVPTGCVSYLSNKLDVGYGVMITASHNAPNMNGIKIMSNLGYKLAAEEESEFEKFMDDKAILPETKKGSVSCSEQAKQKYINYLVQDVGIDLKGMNIALDCAYGSNYEIAVEVFKTLNANVIAINTDAAGDKINVNCGALNVLELREEVLKHKCNFGFAFDGDADRLIVVDEKGTVLNGDDLLFIFAWYLKERNKLNSLKVVGTIMTNQGVEKSLQRLGIGLIRTDVGDRNVIEEMLKNDYSLGGESSGHICVHGLNTTCDALMNALYLLKIIVQKNIKLQDCLLHLKKVDQLVENINVSKQLRAGFDENKGIAELITAVQKKYAAVRVVVRPSGTEPVIRIMAECEDVALTREAVSELKTKLLKLDK